MTTNLDLIPQTTKDKLIDPYELGWFVGLFEGGGCITRCGNKERQKIGAYWQLRLTSTDQDVLERLIKLSGPLGNALRQGGISVHPRGQQANANPHWKTSWTWVLYRQPAVYAVLAMIYQFLGERRRAKAKEALQEMSARGPWQLKRRPSCRT